MRSFEVIQDSGMPTDRSWHAAYLISVKIFWKIGCKAVFKH